MGQKDSAVVILGAGPAGLAAAYGLLDAEGTKVIVLEMDMQVGGISKTVDFGGYRFDLGGHRFFSKIGEVKDLWNKVGGQDFILRKRLSRIYYRKKFYRYPLELKNAFFNVGLLESVRIGLSYLRSKAFPYRKEASFEEWVSNRFGKRLYGMFFKTYTEKVWGIPCSEIQAEWAAQRIKGLSLASAILNALPFGDKKKIKTLIDEFHYPKYGPGMMYEALASRIDAGGGRVLLGHKVTGVRREHEGWTVVAENGGKAEEFFADEVVSTIPVTELVQILTPAPEKSVLEVANGLRYRSFLVVCLVFNKKTALEDNWIYIHDNSVKIGRLQVVYNWSPFMLKDEGFSSYGAEYFCTEGDALWNMGDGELAKLAESELKQIGLIPADCSLVQGNVVRCKSAYPVYDGFYKQNIDTLKRFVASLPNLQVAGRYGMFKYNNMDHSIYTGLLAAKNIIAGAKRYDLWAVNQDEEYHEEVKEKKFEVYEANPPLGSSPVQDSEKI